MIICALYTELCMKNGLWSMVVVTHCRRIYMHCMHAREWGLYNGFVPTYFLCHRALFAVLCQPHIPRLLWCCCRKYPVRSTTASKANRGIPLCLFLLTYTLQSTWWRWKKKKNCMNMRIFSAANVVGRRYHKRKEWWRPHWPSAEETCSLFLLYSCCRSYYSTNLKCLRFSRTQFESWFCQPAFAMTQHFGIVIGIYSNHSFCWVNWKPQMDRQKCTLLHIREAPDSFHRQPPPPHLQQSQF